MGGVDQVKVTRKKREKSMFETKIPDMGRREIEQSKKALNLLYAMRNQQLCWPTIYLGYKKDTK
jgi:hypothetical protein